MATATRSWKHYQAVMGVALDGIYIMDLKGNLLEANDAFCHMLGYTQDEIAHLHISDWNSQYTKDEWQTRLASSIDNNLRFETTHRHKDGSLINVAVNTRGITIDDEIYIFAASRELATSSLAAPEQAEKQLLESEERYRVLITGMTEGVVLMDADGMILTCNPSAERILGLTQKDMAGRTADDPSWGEIHEDGSPYREEDVPAMAALRTGLPQTGVIMGLKRPDADVLWISINAQPLYRPDASSPYAVVATFTDITDRKRIEDALKDAEIYLNAILNNAGAPIFVKDNECRLMLVNDACCTMFGLPRDEIIGKTLAENVPPDEMEHFLAIDRQVLADGKANICEETLTLSGMPSKTILTQKNRFVDATGNYFLVGIIHDITERKQAEKTLQQNEAQFRNLVESFPNGVLLVNSEGKIDLANRRLFEQFGYSMEELIGQTVDILVSDKVRQKHSRFRAEYLNNAQPRRMGMGRDLFAQRKDGSEFPVEIGLQPMDTPSGTATLATIVDISERKANEELILHANEFLEQRIAERTSELKLAKEQAEKASRTKSEFLSRMSHELRTPMNAILGFSQILEVEPLNAEQQGFVQEIYQAGAHLLQLINDLLDISRIESGRMEINIERVRLKTITSQATQIIRPLLQQMNLTLIDECAQDVMLLADATRLKQILVNLLSNAAKYNQQGGRIQVGCRTIDAERLRINITDSGVGISQEDIDRLFIPFERLDRSDNSTIEGTGIGLALTKNMVHLMDGEIGVDSTLGQGSTFWIELPCLTAKTEIATSNESQMKGMPLGNAKILYIEDNAANLKLVESILRKQHNLNLITATNGEYGLELATRYQPDVILLDIKLPGLDGFAVLKELQAKPETRHIPVIAISADAMPLDVQRGLDAGFRYYLTKPISATELTETISLLLNTKTR